jgi:4-hydroxy-tetrahydrodipicolinate synthase
LDAGDLLRVAQFDNVIGVKQSVGCMDTDTLELLHRAPPEFLVFAGDDAFIVPTLLMGGAGAIAAAAHLCTPMFVTMVGAALAGDAGRARRLAEALLPVITTGFAEPNPAGWKAALHCAGEIASPHLRAPMAAAGAETTDLIMAAVAGAAGAN